MDGRAGTLLPARGDGGGRGGLALADRAGRSVSGGSGAWAHLVLPPTGLVFAARHPRKGAVPFVLAVLGILVAAAPPLYTLAVPLDLAPARTWSTASGISP